jgi:hypothetical protein
MRATPRGHPSPSRSCAKKNFPLVAISLMWLYGGSTPQPLRFLIVYVHWHEQPRLYSVNYPIGKESTVKDEASKVDRKNFRSVPPLNTWIDALTAAVGLPRETSSVSFSRANTGWAPSLKVRASSTHAAGSVAWALKRSSISRVEDIVLVGRRWAIRP